MKSNVLKLSIRRAVIAVTVTVLMLAGSATAYAWFTNQRRLATITKVNSPIVLAIGAGAKESSLNIDIGGIDVEDDPRKKDFVFSVYSDESVEKYKLQIAHTTNIDFVYTVYKAVEHTSDPGNDRVEYTAENGNVYYYTKSGGAIPGSYLNFNGKIADNSLHDKSYGGYNRVQENAEPLYWQTADAIQPTNNNLSGFLDYYILEISWNEDVVNNKETDMVYLTAGIA